MKQISPTIVLLVVAILLSAYVATVLGRVEARLKQVQPLTIEDVRNAVRTEITAMLKETVTTESGREVEVTTTQNDKEDWEDTVARHKERVAYVKANL